MADPVKISELPALTSVQPNDIVPIVDSGLTQTSKATVSQIAAIGGGPPGDGSVTTVKLASNAVTAAKCSFTGPDKLISRTVTGAGEGTEIPCTPYARGLLAVSNSTGARTYLDALQSTASPTFSGTVTVSGDMVVSGPITANGGINGQMRAGDGTASGPSYSFSGDTNTGLSRLGGSDTLSLVTGGVERLRVGSDGTMSAPVRGGTTLYPLFGCRAFCSVHFFGANDERGPSPTDQHWGNVSSVTRESTGYYAVNFATPMPDANYAIVCSANASIWSGAEFDDQWIATPKGLLSTLARIATGDNDNNALRDTYLYVAIFR